MVQKFPSDKYIKIIYYKDKPYTKYFVPCISNKKTRQCKTVFLNFLN